MAESKENKIEHRLQTACGHLSAVISMIENDRDCLQILHQLGAVQSALQEIERLMIEDEIHAFTEIIRAGSCVEERTAGLIGMLEFYELFLKKPNQSDMERIVWPDLI